MNPLFIIIFTFLVELCAADQNTNTTIDNNENKLPLLIYNYTDTAEGIELDYINWTFINEYENKRIDKINEGINTIKHLIKALKEKDIDKLHPHKFNRIKKVKGKHRSVSTSITRKRDAYGQPIKDELTKRSICSNDTGYIGAGVEACKYYAYVAFYEIGTVRNWLNEKAYAYVKYGAFIVSLGSDITTIVSGLLGISKSSGCGGMVFLVNSDGWQYAVALSTWTKDGKTNCATSTDAVTLSKVFAETFKDWQNRSVISGCVAADNLGDWRGDTRIQIADLSWNIWDIPCD